MTIPEPSGSAGSRVDSGATTTKGMSWRARRPRGRRSVLPAVAGCAPDAALYRVDWIPLPSATEPEPAPADPGDLLFTVPAAADDAAREVMVRVQRPAAEADPAVRRLVLVTSGDVGVEDSDAALTASPGADVARGLGRTAQSELPGRVVLLDTDGSDASLSAVPAALATGEPELALRVGTVYVPRLVRAGAPAAAALPALDPEGTVLITGGTGALGMWWRGIWWWSTGCGACCWCRVVVRLRAVRVPGRADPGEDGDFFTAQAGRPSAYSLR